MFAQRDEADRALARIACGNYSVANKCCQESEGKDESQEPWRSGTVWKLTEAHLPLRRCRCVYRPLVPTLVATLLLLTGSLKVAR